MRLNDEEADELLDEVWEVGLEGLWCRRCPGRQNQVGLRLRVSVSTAKEAHLSVILIVPL